MATLPSGSNLAVIVPLDRRSVARFTHTIYQEDVIRLKLKQAKARQSAREAEEEEDFISAALRSGAQMEPGIHNVRLLTYDCKPRRVKGGPVTKLVVR